MEMVVTLAPLALDRQLSSHSVDAFLRFHVSETFVATCVIETPAVITETSDGSPHFQGKSCFEVPRLRVPHMFVKLPGRLVNNSPPTPPEVRVPGRTH